MFGFFVKKSFCDVWDNNLHLMAVNFFINLYIVLSVFIFSLLHFLPFYDSTYIFLEPLMIFLLSAGLGICLVAQGKNACHIADYDSPSIGDFFAELKTSVKDGALFGFFVCFLILLAIKTLPFYAKQFIETSNPVFIFFTALVFWFLLVTVLALQYLIAIICKMNNSFFKALKKSYIILFDNTGFTVGLALINVWNIIFSALTFGLVNGWSGILITNSVALKLRLYKYDWLEVNPELTPAQKKQVPWKDLIAKDKKTLGERNLKSFIMPWK